MKIKYFGAAIAACLTISNVFSQSYFSRVIEQPDIVPERYAEICEDFYTSFDKLLDAGVDSRVDGTPNIVVDVETEEITVTIRLSINEAQYSAWKNRTYQKIETLKLSNRFTSFEDPKARSIAGRGYRFGDNEETAISHWEENNVSVMRVRDYLILVEYLNHQGQVIESIYIPISRFQRIGFTNYPLPLHHLNRLRELPSNTKWGEDENSYYIYTRENTTLEWMNSISDIRCKVLSLEEVHAYQKMAERIAREKAVPELISNMVKIPECEEHKGLYFGKYEVTQAQWLAVMGVNPSYFTGDLIRPVECVSWNDCQEFIKKLNALPSVKLSGLVFRLPTAKEWEYACRAGSKGKYGLLTDGTEGTLDEMGWYDNSGEKTHPVGQKKPNAWGLYDMHGNVWEWTVSEYSSEDDSFRICCGGGFFNNAESCEAGRGSYSNPVSRYNILGFRLMAETMTDIKAREEAERVARENAVPELIKNMVKIPDDAEYQGFYFGKYEVTQAQWLAIMGKNPSVYTGDLSLPVENVSFVDCQEFIKKLNALPEVKQLGLVFRLPTIDEWNYACLAGGTGEYGLLEEGREGMLEEMGWYDENSGGKTHPVGQKMPNAWGLYDMHGNVWEWTASAYGEGERICGGSCFTSDKICSADANGHKKDIINIIFGPFGFGFRLMAETTTHIKAREEAVRIAGERIVPEIISNMVCIPDSAEYQGLYFGKYEVTQAQWFAIMGKNPSVHTGDLSLPVENVSFVACQEFIKKLNALPSVKLSGLVFRLPTAEEWEYACCAGSKGKYGLLTDGTEGTLDEMGWYRDNSGNNPHPVGQKKPNAWGLYDMHGNVDEWTASEYDNFRILRGGSWNDDAENCGVDYVIPTTSDFQYFTLGFRLVASRITQVLETEHKAPMKTEVELKVSKKAEVEREIFVAGIEMVCIPDSSTHKGLYFGKYEVTQAQWQAIMGNNPSYFTGDSSRPVEKVSWNYCQEFIKKLNARPDVKSAGITFRLPTEEEWEYACRAGSTGKYGLLANGREGTLDEMGWYSGNSGDETHPVGQKKPNAWGLYDMHGNVWEWTASALGSARIYRGGCCYYDASYCESDFGLWLNPDYRGDDLGFRLVASRTVY